MNGPRSKVVSVGGRDVTIRPMFGIDQREMETRTFSKNTDGVIEMVLMVLKRTAPDITADWLLRNSDQTEYTDILSAYREVTTGKKDAASGEVPAPSPTGETSTP